jgi:hypothetical protein
VKLSRKKFLIISLTFLLLVATVAFFVIPLQANVHEEIRFSTNSDALFRQLTNENSWVKWWPGKTGVKDGKTTLELRDFVFQINQVYPNSFEMSTNSNKDAAITLLSIRPETNNSVTVTLKCQISLSKSPVERIRLLMTSSKLKESFKTILQKLAGHFEQTKNLYDLDIKETTVAFEFFSATSRTLTHDPSTSEVYQMVDEIKSFIKGSGGNEIGFPMLHVEGLGKNEYFVQVAIPTDRALSLVGDIKTKWMLKGGHILTGKVVGDRKEIANGIKQMQNYIQDHQKSTMAMFFEYLITNRLQEPDSTKWITELYFPVM